jgi:hypothetical protein
MEISQLIAIALGAAWASGLNLYAAIATLGILATTGQMTLPPGLEILSHPAMIAAAGFMYCVEFFADKIPGVDTGWDAIHSFIRIPAGAVLAAGALGDMNPAIQAAALILGGGVAATTHALKAGSRVLINTSPEPVTNWTASVIEDGLAIGGVILAVFHPVAFFVLIAGFGLFAIWFAPKIWRGLTLLWIKISGFFRRTPASTDSAMRERGRLSLSLRTGATPDPE